jgi:NADH dehydrogenase
LPPPPDAGGVSGAGAVWAIGDSAAVPDSSRQGRPCPPTAQHAIRQGRQVARNVVATLGGGRARPFRYRTKGVVAELGQREAVAITLGIRWRGFPAWLIARTYHLLLMPGTGRRLRLLVDWNVALVFGRDASSPGVLGSPTSLRQD